MKSLACLALLLSTLVLDDAGASEIQAFRPGGQTIIVSATTTAATATPPGAGGSLLVYNACTVVVRVDGTGNAAATPVAGSPPTPGSLGVPPSTLAVLEFGAGVASFSVKVDSGSACNVELTRGEGMAH